MALKFCNFHGLSIIDSMKKVVLYIILVINLSGYFECDGQNRSDSANSVKLETIDGNIFVGNIINEDSVSISIRTEYLGEIRIPRNYIRSSTKLRSIKKIGKDFWLPNPQSSRYFWAPNGYGLEKGTSYYQNIWILYNQYSYGLTNNFSIGAGTLPLFLFGGAASPFWIVPKFSVPLIDDKLNMGTGAFLGTVIGEQASVYGLIYATSTCGSRDKNLSMGLAYGFADRDWMNRPIINLSFLVRSGPRGYLISENYYISTREENVLLVSLGGRSIIRNIGIDYSLWIPCSSLMDTYIVIPFLGITVPIGRKQ